MFPVIRNLLILAARGMFQNNRFGIATAAAFGTQFGFNHFTLSLALVLSSIVAGLIAAFLISFGIATWTTYKQIKASRPKQATTA